MISLVLRFPSGRYHATPWGRHVNEADIEWPPAPWRVLRALIAVYWRKADRDRFAENDLATLIDELAGGLPVYRLPNGVHAHTRHYMPIREGSSEKTTLVFDAFARVDAADELAIGWPNVDLSSRSAELLAHLVPLLGYLGRAEAWVEAEIREGEENSFPWRPHDSGHVPPNDERLMHLLAPLSAAEWQKERDRHLDTLPTENERSKAQRAMAIALPQRLATAIALDTADWKAGGWNIPPSAHRVLYRAPMLTPVARGRGTSMNKKLPTVARFVLAGRPLPPIEDAVRVGELMRLATLSKFGRDENGRWRAPPVISGRAPDGRPLTHAGHAHAFFLPEDADNDGKIDHVIVFVGKENGFDSDVQRALDRVTRLWVEPRDRARDEDDEAGGRKEWRLALEGFGQAADFEESKLLRRGRHWISVTPYLRPWHAKRNFGVAEQIRREVVERGMLSEEMAAAMTVEVIGEISVGGRPRRPVHFHRFRSRRGLIQPDKLGSLVALTTPIDIPGPLALGFACHFGLGLFRSNS